MSEEKMNIKDELAMFAALGDAIRETAVDIAFTEEFKKKYGEASKEFPDQPVEAFRIANKAATLEMLKQLPLLMRVNYFCNKFSDANIENVVLTEDQIDWKYINEALSSNIGEDDYNATSLEVNSIKELRELKTNISLALSDIQPYIIRTCKSCKEKFTMNFGEVYYFASNDLAVPKRCHKCRKTRKNNNNKTETEHVEKANKHSNSIKKSSKTVEDATRIREEEREEFKHSSMADALKKAGF